MNRPGKKAGAVGLLAAGAVAGGILAGTLSAGAATPNATTSSPAASATPGPGTPGQGAPGAGAPGRGGGPGPGGAQPMRSDEKLVTGSDLSTLTAAALKAVPGGTVIRVETDAGDGVYEAHVKKADGSCVTVKFDKDLKVIKVEAGMGLGDPHGAGAGAPGTPGGAPPA
jgi:hypothetical protein